MNDSRSRAARSYLETRIRGASPGELVSLLYEALARALRDASDAVDRGDVVGKGAGIVRALDIVGHLRTSLDHERGQAVATNLERLYAYWTARLTDANVRSVRAPLDETLRHLEELRSAWNEAIRAPAAGAHGEAAETPALAAAGGRPR